MGAPQQAGVGSIRNFGVGGALLASPANPGAASSSPPELADVGSRTTVRSS
jgi:hypothetical protein